MNHLAINPPTLPDDALLELGLLIAREVAQREALRKPFLAQTKQGLKNPEDPFWDDQSGATAESLDVGRALARLYPELKCRVRVNGTLGNRQVEIDHDHGQLGVRYEVHNGLENIEYSGSRIHEGTRECQLLLYICQAAAAQDLNLGTTPTQPNHEQQELIASRLNQPIGTPAETPLNHEDLELQQFIAMPNDPKFIASMLTPVTCLALLKNGPRLALITATACNGTWMFGRRPVVRWNRGEVNATLTALFPGEQCALETLSDAELPSAECLGREFYRIASHPAQEVC